MTGPTGQVESRQKYLPFGELLDQSGSSYIISKGYTNHEQTDTSGLIYMQARFYMPWMGRFTSPDPARDQHFEDTQSWNIYSYVRNKPIMSTDPTGMEEAINAHARKGADNDERGLQDDDTQKKRKKAEVDRGRPKNTNDGEPKPGTKMIPAGGIAPSLTPGSFQPLMPATTQSVSNDSASTNAATISTAIKATSHTLKIVASMGDGPVAKAAGSAGKVAPIASILGDINSANAGNMTKAQVATNAGITAILYGLGKAAGAEVASFAGLIVSEIKWANQQIEDFAKTFPTQFTPR